jgi:hypothetical protein
MEIPQISEDKTAHVLGSNFRYERNSPGERQEIAEEIFRMINEPGGNKYTRQFAESLGFNKIIGDHNGEKFLEIHGGEKDILTILDEITANTNGGYSIALNILLSVTTNGMQREKASIILDAVKNSKGESLKALRTDFERRKDVPGLTFIPNWAIFKYYPDFSLF